MANEIKGNRGTIYQQLNKMLNLDGFGFADSNLQNQEPTTQNRPKIIIKGDSPQDLQRKALELQQKQELEGKFFRTTDRGFQKAMQYEAARLPAYLDYEGMEYYPIIASALDVIKEECTSIGQNGKMLNVYSDKERIKIHLEELFYDILNVNVNLPFWTRNTIKYGDNFCYILGEKKKGIVHIKQMVNYEMERIERIEHGKATIKFKQRQTGDAFNVFEIAHFRILGDDKYLPYGSSILNKIRRVFRQLIMAEDAMLTYRIIRAGEKRIFRIDVGNIDEDDIEPYIQKIATRFKKQQQVYGDTGQIDYRFNILGNDEDFFIPVRNANVQTGIDTLQGACFALDTKIELLDGRSLSLNEIINEYENGKQLWSYSINPDNGLIVPGKITWAGITRKNTQVLKLTLDNGETITCTPDHKFPTKFNGIKEAKDLTIGESMWSFNKKFEKIISNKNKEKYDKEYEMIYNHNTNKWVYTHRMIGEYFKKINKHNEFNYNDKYANEDKKVIHHSNFNRFDNSPDNLFYMSYKDHFKYHSDIGYKNVLNFEMENKIKKLNNGFYNYYNNLNENEKKARSENISKKQKNRIKNFTENEKNKFLNTLRLAREKSFSKESRDKLRKTMQSKEYKEKMKIIGKKVRNDEIINNKIKISQSYTYDNSLLDYLHNYINLTNNFKLENFVNHINNENNKFHQIFFNLNKNKPHIKSFNKFTRKNVLKLIRYYNYDNWNSFINNISCYNHKIISIEWLDQLQDTGTITIDGNEELHNYHTFALSCGIFTKNSNLDQIADIEYLRDNLFVGMGIPKPFVGYQATAGEGRNLAQQDVRFSKKVSTIQQAMIQELNKIAIIHLFYLGFEEKDLGNFNLTLTNPSTQQELLKAELWQQKAAVYTELTRNEAGIAAMSHTEAKRLLFNMSDKEIIEDFKKQRMERAIAQELQDSPLIIRKTGIFDDIDEKYGNPEAAAMMSGMTGMGGGEMGAGANQLGPAGGLGGGLEGKNEPLGKGGGGNFPTAQSLPPVIGQGMGFKEDSNIIYERKSLTENQFNKLLEKLVHNGNIEKVITEPQKIISENNEKNSNLNKTANVMINEINDLLKNSDTLNITEFTNEKKEDKKFDEVDFNIDEIDVDKNK